MGSGDQFPKLRATAIQAAPAFLDRDATIGIVDEWTRRAAMDGADLVVFPESFVPGFPLWNLVHAPIDQHIFFEALVRNAMIVPSPQSDALGAIARTHQVHLSVGITERARHSLGTMFNSNLLFDPAGRLINHRRKIVPTWAEKLSWGSGDASQLRPVDSAIGRLGMLICGENTNTLARYALLAQGEQVHISSYPPVWPVRRPDSAKPQYNLARAIELRAAAHSFEGKVFNVVSSGFLDEVTIERVADGDEEVAKALTGAPSGVSLIVHPSGELCGDPLTEGEGMVSANLDIADSIQWKQIHDIVGHYQRPDLFQVRLDQRPQNPIEVLQRAAGADEMRRPEWPDEIEDLMTREPMAEEPA